MTHQENLEVLHNLITSRKIKADRVENSFFDIPVSAEILAEGWEERLESLGRIVEESCHCLLTLAEVTKRRQWFDEHKSKIIEITPTSRCMVCGVKACDRHHKIPLENDGPSKRGNLVLLCDNCHWVLTEYQRYFSRPAREDLERFLNRGARYYENH
jgi:hypothetical protein